MRFLRGGGESRQNDEKRDVANFHVTLAWRKPGGLLYIGGRPLGPTMPCGWSCSSQLTASEMRLHFTRCSKRPKRASVDEMGTVPLLRSRLRIAFPITA